MARHAWLLCLVALSLRGILQVSGSYQVVDCCLRTSPVPILAKFVSAYYEQRIQEGCPVRAVVFITVRGKHLCAPPNAGWVKHLIVRLGQRHFGKRLPWTSS